jgi:hypothetical protein
MSKLPKRIFLLVKNGSQNCEKRVGGAATRGAGGAISAVAGGVIGNSQPTCGDRECVRYDAYGNQVCARRAYIR